MAILKDLIVHGSSRFLNKIYASEIQTPLIEAEAGIIKKLKADDATVVGLLDVKGQLHTNNWSNSNIATIDGSFYITPTIGSASGTVTITASSLVFSGTNYAVSSLYLGDGSSITWPQYSKVLVTGQILSNGEWIPLGTLLGQLSNTATAASISINNIKDNKNQTSNVLTTLVNEGTTSSNYRNLKVSLYQRASSSTTFYPLGIYMTATGTNGRTFLDIYGGVEALSNSNNYGGFAEPNVRIGNLQGLPNVGGQTPSGWGIYTDNGYFKGIIAADQGYIGSGSKYWVIANEEDLSNAENSRSFIYNGTNSISSNTQGIYLGTDGIRNYEDSTHFVTIKDGVITAQGVNLSGTINASSGYIAGWRIDSTYLSSTDASAPGENILILSPKGTSSSYTIASQAKTGWMITAGTSFGVNKDGGVYASKGRIGGWTVDGNSLTMGTWGTENSAMICTGSNTAKSIGGSEATVNGWIFTAGAHFGVTKLGALYASSANISGKVVATEGSIGGINIVNGNLDVSSISIGNLSGANDYAQKSYVDNAVDNIEIGGRNLILNTLYPDATGSDLKRPHIIGQITNTGGRGTCTIAEHGIRFTNTTSNWQYIYFGASSNTATPSMLGLEAGETYTLSADLSWNILSSDSGKANATTNYMGAFLAYSSVESGSWSVASRNNQFPITQADKGTDMSGRLVYTFTVPEDAVRLHLGIRADTTMAAHYGVGDYIEARNLKLEKGNKATSWTPAPEDVDEAIDNINVIGVNLIPLSENLKSFTIENSTRSTVTYTDDSCTIVNTYGSAKYGIYYNVDVEPNSTYTLSFQASNVSGTNVNYSVGNRTPNQTASWYDITNGYKDIIDGKNVCTFTIPDTVTVVRIYICAGSLNGTVTISNLKLEIGEKATEWVPASKDVQDARKVATNYLAVDNTGIMIADMKNGGQTPSGILSGNNVFINSTSVNIRDGQTTLASFSANSIQIGREVNKCYITIQDDSINIYHSNEELVHFGYGLNNGQNGVENSPYYTLGARESYSSIGSHSVVEGLNNTASNWCSYAQGYNNTASGLYSHAEGTTTTASGSASHVEGFHSIASGDFSHAEGILSEANGYASHAEGSSCIANGNFSHTEGFSSRANGHMSCAKGYFAKADAYMSYAEGPFTIAASNYQHVQGKCNITDEDGKYAFIIGNGEYQETPGEETVVTRSNAFTVDWDGNVEFSGNMYCAGGNYLPSNINIDNLTKKHSGWWVYARSDISGTFPITDTYGTIGHIQGTSDNVAMQFLRSNTQGATNPILYTRYKIGGTWGAWQRYVNAITSNLTITRTNNNYCNATDIGYLQAYKKGGYLSLRGNLHFTTSMPTGTENVQIATISNWQGVSGLLCIPAQTGNSTLTVSISSSGTITISNYSGVATGANWFRFTFTTPCEDGYE